MGRLQLDDLALRATEGGLTSLPGAHAAVKTLAGADATIYAAETGPGTLANPLTVDAYGRYGGWVDGGVDYDVTVTYNGRVEGVRRVVGAVISAGVVQWAADPDLIIVGAITRDIDGAAIAAGVVWPDGVTGAYVGTPSTAFPGAVDAYTVTRGAATYTQPALTRDSNGAVTARPAIVVT
jgi:hypothetical protein